MERWKGLDWMRSGSNERWRAGEGGEENEAYTVTFGDRAENEVGWQIIGKAAAVGPSVKRLRQIQQKSKHGYGPMLLT